MRAISEVASHYRQFARDKFFLWRLEKVASIAHGWRKTAEMLHVFERKRLLVISKTMKTEYPQRLSPRCA